LERNAIALGKGDLYKTRGGEKNPHTLRTRTFSRLLRARPTTKARIMTTGLTSIKTRKIRGITLGRGRGQMSGPEETSEGRTQSVGSIPQFCPNSLPWTKRGQARKVHLLKREGGPVVGGGTPTALEGRLKTCERERRKRIPWFRSKAFRLKKRKGGEQRKSTGWNEMGESSYVIYLYWTSVRPCEGGTLERGKKVKKGRISKHT